MLPSPKVPPGEPICTLIKTDLVPFDSQVEVGEGTQGQFYFLVLLRIGHFLN